MTFAADREVLLARLDEELRGAAMATPALFARIIAACGRIPAPSKAGKATRLERLIENTAWTEAAIALIELELPLWMPRRLIFESGEWFCSLSRQPNLPADLDDSADGVHQQLPLAILLAFVEARRGSRARHEIISVVPQLRATADNLLCCDNFA
jgi:hypothetical protein